MMSQHDKKYDFKIKSEVVDGEIVLCGYAQKTPTCKKCIESNKSWQALIERKTNVDEFLKSYYSRDIDTLCLCKEDRQCNADRKIASLVLLDQIKKIEIDKILNIIDKIEHFNLDSNEIPQPGSWDAATIELYELLKDNIPRTYDEIGMHLRPPEGKMGAYKKYGESHSKLAALIGTVEFSGNKPYHIRITPLGKIIMLESEDIQRDFYIKQILRVPIIQFLLKNAKNNVVSISACLKSVKGRGGNHLTETTVGRRSSSIIPFYIGMLKNSDNVELNRRISNIVE